MYRFLREKLDWEPVYFFTDEATFYGGSIRNWIWIVPNLSYDISTVKSSIKINVWISLNYKRNIDLQFYKEK